MAFTAANTKPVQTQQVQGAAKLLNRPKKNVVNDDDADDQPQAQPAKGANMLMQRRKK